MQTYAVGLANRRRKVTLERVDAVTQDGRVIVRGRALPITGRVPILPGEQVAVAWQDGEPVVVLMNEGRRSGNPPALAPPAGAVVEELFLAPQAAGGQDDVYFRNATQTTLLTGGSPPRTCRAQIAAAGFTITAGSYSLRGWGLDHRRFVVQFTNLSPLHPMLAVFRMAGDEETPITTKASAKLERTYDVGASGLALGTVTWDQNIFNGAHLSTQVVLGVLVSTGYTRFVGLALAQTIGGGITGVVLRKDRHLIVGVNATIVNQDGSLAGFGTYHWQFPFVVDLTAGAVLFNGFDAHGSWPGGVYDGAHFINASSTGGAFDGDVNSFGGAMVQMVPTKRGNALRLFAAVRGNQALVGATFQWVGSRIGASPPVTIFQFQSSTTDSSHIWPITWNQRYVMWARARGSSASFGGVAFTDPFASVLTAYDFKEGLHVADLGAGEVLAVVDKVALTDRDAIIAHLDTTPFLVSLGLLYQDFDDLRVLRSTKPHFAVFRAGGGVLTPFPAALKTLGALSPFDDLKAFRRAEEFILAEFADDYDVSGHSDPVVGYGIVADKVFVQAIPVPGVAIPPT